MSLRKAQEYGDDCNSLQSHWCELLGCGGHHFYIDERTNRNTAQTKRLEIEREKECVVGGWCAGPIPRSGRK